MILSEKGSEESHWGKHLFIEITACLSSSLVTTLPALTIRVSPSVTAWGHVFLSSSSILPCLLSLLSTDSLKD